MEEGQYILWPTLDDVLRLGIDGDARVQRVGELQEADQPARE